MTRKPNVWFPGAKYHIYSRGNRKSPLFIDGDDRENYLNIIKEAMERYPFILHAYCLMTNHTHLQVETSQVPPTVFMKMINTNYAKYFNKKYDLTGHVFEKRYNWEIIDSLLYELDVNKYIHLNPLRAGMVDILEDYPWSSYRAYVFKEENPIITTDHILSYFPSPPTLNYQKFIYAPKTDLSLFELNTLINNNKYKQQ